MTEHIKTKLNNQWFKNTIIQIRKYFKLNGKENILHQAFVNASKALLREFKAMIGSLRN